VTPLLVLERIERFLDREGLGSGPVRASPLGVAGSSNFTFLLERDDRALVLRRPPPPPLPTSTHDVVREARLQRALAAQEARVPAVLAVCEDAAVTGAPFYVMEHVPGDVVDDVLPARLADDAAGRRALALDLVDALVEIHAVDAGRAELDPFRRPGSYTERQIRRFSGLWPVNRTRDLPVQELGERLAATLPTPLPDSVVHGDYRLGNVLADPAAPRVRAVLDWELGAIGDPRADLGYLVATWTEPGGEESPLGLSPVTGTPGFPSRAELVARYEERSGRRVERLAWFEALGLWRAAVFCEAIYGRHVRGELAEAEQAARLGARVPLLIDAAAAALARDRA
jgi:aminoglycoside phosphotransferase (APT) family kinase protein